MKLKAYEIKSNGEIDVVFAFSKSEALSLYLNLGGVDLDDLIGFSMKRITKSEINSYFVKDEDGKVVNLTYLLNRRNEPCHISSTANS